jgi:restriction system protein
MNSITGLIVLFAMAIAIQIFLKPNKKRKKKKYTNKKSNNKNQYEYKKFERKENKEKDSYKYNRKKTTNPNQGYNGFYKNQKTKTSYAEKIKKGKEYEEYIAKFFREQNYTVWEHGKEKGKKDSSIDLFIKKDKYIYFVQCKNWENWKINHKEVKATRMDVREYLKENKEFWNLIKNYEMKILYITPKECLTKGAYTYIQENKNIVEYQVIPMKTG